MSSISERLLMVRGKVKQGTFAARLGINPNTLRGYESGRVSPSFDVLAKICVEFSVEPTWLLLGVDPMIKPEGHEGISKLVLPASSCSRCMELYAKLVQAQEREIELLKENRALEAEISALQTRTSPSTDSAASLEKSA